MLKEEIRTVYKQKRASLPVAGRLKMDDLLLIQLQRLGFKDIDTILSFWPLEKQYEVNTHLYSRYLEHLIPGLRVAFPVIDSATDVMTAVLVSDYTEFTLNKYGIPEPQNGDELLPDEIDLVFVPLLAFDRRGYRVGYGKGFYDRFLSKCRKEVLKVGFSYFDPVDKVEDAGQYDIPLNYCITPERIYEF